MEIAIVGMSGQLPGCSSIEEFWEAVKDGKSLASDVPRYRWGRPEKYISKGDTKDRAFHARGYFGRDSYEMPVDFTESAESWERLDPLIQMAIRVSSDALADSLSKNSALHPRTAAVFGNIALPTEKSGRIVDQYLRHALFHRLGVDNNEKTIEDIDARNYFPASMPAIMVAKTFGFGLGGYSVDAACASSLYALEQACDMLLENKADMVLAGGFNRANSLYTQMGFTQLGALSPTGHSRPFDERGDGLIVGEGGAVFVLKRLLDAESSGDRIYGVIRGIGLSNDRSGKLMAPDSEGQTRAMRDAYQAAGWTPQDIDYIECHATGTPKGDRTELESLRQLYSGRRGSASLGSVKGNIGHLLTGAGASGLLRLLLAMKNKTKPPLLKETQVIDSFPWKDSGLSVSLRQEPWDVQEHAKTRKAALSGFGFGGINAHVLIEEYNSDRSRSEVISKGSANRRVALVAMGEHRPETTDPCPKWFGFEASPFYQKKVAAGLKVTTSQFDDFNIPYASFRIPPKEVQDMLPQQIGALLSVNAAMKGLDLEANQLEKAAVYVGVELDGMVNAYLSRWWFDGLDTEGMLEISGEGHEEKAEIWIEQAKDALLTQLNANKVIGSLASIVASRIGREYRVGGSAITVSQMDGSGLRALSLALRDISSGKRNLALVTGVDTPAEVFSALNWRSLFNEASAEHNYTDSAITLVLEDYETAKAKGHPILCVIDDGDANLVSRASSTSGSIHYGACQGIQTLAQFISADSGQDTKGFHYSGPFDAGFQFQIEKQSPTLPKHFAVSSDTKAFKVIVRGGEVDVSHLKRTSPIAGAQKSPNYGALKSHTAAERPLRKDLMDSHIYSHILSEMGRTNEAQVAAQQAFESLTHASLQNQTELLKQAMEAKAPTAVTYDESLVDFDGVIGSETQRVDHEQAIDNHIAYQPMNPKEALWDYEACETFALGKIGDVFGPEFAHVDEYPTRVRLPSDRLLLCHRIMDISGEKFSLGSGTLVTEHDVNPDAWYLDQNKIPTSIAIESGQADLLLSAWLGADDHTKGLALYRLLDAEVTFYSALPSAGEYIRYDIHIDNFFKRGSTLLFRFGFSAYVGDKKLMTMRHGCAGFFTSEELDQGRGIIKSQEEVEPGVFTGGYQHRFAFENEVLSADELDYIRGGNLAKAFGDDFQDLDVRLPVGIPGGDLRLVHRITEMSSHGGKFGVGLVIGEADIQPDDWFLTCHFKDDHVMPGTLMYECCLHTLRVFLLRQGLIGETGEVTIDPVQGEMSKLLCRGQVLPRTKSVQYELHIREIGFNPNAYALVDAYMYSDHHCIVDIRNMTLQMTGVTKESVDKVWGSSEQELVFSDAMIKEFAAGHPSKAFGAPYKKFDHDRKMARLPRGRLQCINEVISTSAKPFVLKEGSEATAIFYNQSDSWFYDNPSKQMPYSILLEVALQPCGWMAAYMGSALASENEDLFFRNLQGASRYSKSVTPDMGPLTAHAKVTKISQASGMIIQEYSYRVMAGDDEIYSGTTAFGFFSAKALAEQQGITPQTQRFTDLSSEWIPVGVDIHTNPLSLIDDFSPLNTDVDKAIVARMKGRLSVEASQWFFHDHFYQDPVMPGSLGLESILMTASAAARDILGLVDTPFALAPGSEQQWVYRGQVLPDNKLVETEIEVISVDESSQSVTFDAYLYCDNLAIYQAKRFVLRAINDEIA